jgi:hypothetical protein
MNGPCMGVVGRIEVLATAIQGWGRFLLTCSQAIQEGWWDEKDDCLGFVVLDYED